MPVQPITPHTQLNAFVNAAMVVIQPRDPTPVAGQLDTLTIDLNNGSVQQQMSAPLKREPLAIVAIIGVCRLFRGQAVVVATSARVVTTVLGADIYEITGTQVITTREARLVRENRPFLKLLKEGVDPEGAGRSMYFSHFYDVTLTAQRTALVALDSSPAMQTAAARADKRFFWNQVLVQPLVAAGAHRFVVPVMFGFVGQVSDLRFNSSSGGGSPTGSLTLIARRCVQRAGTRHWRRGADMEGDVANFVESEQILQVQMQSGPGAGPRPAGAEPQPVVASYVQLRGSVPLLWTELPNLKYKPTRVIAPPEEQGQVFTKHLNQLHDTYGSMVAINLINQHGGEGKLEKAFRAQFEQFLSAGGKAARYVPFDFHKQCGAKNYHRMSLLWDQVAPDFAQHDFFLFNSSGLASKQKGVMRTNCIDCLDRTNVVQGMLARANLEQVLRQLGLLPKDRSLAQVYPDFEQQYRVLWADHGDAIASQYAGTGALKSGFTRTGKRTFGGILDDGVKSVARYYLNNFQDGKKQDAVDLVTGAYTPVTGRRPPFKKQSSPLVPLALALLLLLMGLHKALQLPAQSQEAEGVTVQGVVTSVVVPLLLSAAVLVLTARNGKHLVNKPQLCPALAATVTKPKKQ